MPDDLDARLRSWVAERDLAGAVLVTRAGTTLLEGCYGPADRASGALNAASDKINQEKHEGSAEANKRSI